MLLVSSCSCLCPIHWSQMLSREWRCSWSRTDRWCSNYIWVINNFIVCFILAGTFVFYEWKYYIIKHCEMFILPCHNGCWRFGDTRNQGPVSIYDKTFFRKISWSLEAARLGSLSLTGASTALLPGCLSNFRAIGQFWAQIWWLRDFTRSYDKPSYRILKQGPSHQQPWYFGIFLTEYSSLSTGRFQYLNFWLSVCTQMRFPFWCTSRYAHPLHCTSTICLPFQNCVE